MTDAKNDIRAHAIETAKHEPAGITYAGYLSLDDLLSAQHPRNHPPRPRRRPRRP